MKKRLLFVCTSNLDRSPAAESLFKGSGKCEARSCGLLPHSDVQVSKDLVRWADVILVMDERKEMHKTLLLERFPEAWDKEIVVLGIPNTYCRNDPELERLLREKLARFMS